MLGKMLGFTARIINPNRFINKVTGKEKLFENTPLDERTQLILSKTEVPVGMFIDKSLSIIRRVFIPVFDTVRVFASRIWKGKSPFQADKTHIHHLLTNAGFSHVFATRLICVLHGFILIEVYWLRDLREEYILLILVTFMLIATAVLKNMRVFFKKSSASLSSSFIEN